jgi:zinc protease
MLPLPLSYIAPASPSVTPATGAATAAATTMRVPAAAPMSASARPQPNTGSAAPVGVALFTRMSPSGYPITMYVLNNGHRVLIEQRPHTDVVSLRTFIKTGSINEDPVYPSSAYQTMGSPSGIAHLDEHCHFLTTQHFTRPYSWTDKIADYGSDFNASTSNEVIQHELLCNKEDLPTMVAMHGEAVLRPFYQPDLISKEKTNVINEIGERSRPAYARIHNQLMTLMYSRPDFQTHGRIQDIKKTTTQDLQRFQDRWYRPSNMITVISGNVQPDQVLGMVNKQFGKTPVAPTPPPSQHLTLTLPNQPRQSVLHLPDLVQPVVLMGFAAPSRMQTRDRMAMTFIQILLGSGSTSRLNETLKNQQHVVSNVSVSYEPTQQTGCLEISMDTPTGQELNAMQATLQQLQLLRTQPITLDKLNELKDKLKDSFTSSLEQSQVATLSLGEEATYQSLGYYLNFPKLVDSMTVQDLQRVAHQYLTPNRYAAVLAYPQTGALS